MAEIYQVKNTGNKCWVKMRAGRVLENRPISEGKFPDIPVKSKPQKDDETVDTQETDSGSYSFFEFD